MGDLSDFNINEFNNLIKTANETISCGPDCMNQRQTEQLQKTYLDAESNMVSAPQQFFSAEKEYITYTQGESGYNTHIENKLQSNADKIVTDFQNKFNENVNAAMTSIANYEGLLINFNNVIDLYKKYKKENIQLEKQLKNISSDILTNDRKSYYEDEGLKRLETYYYFFLFFYIFVLIVFILSIFLVKTNVKFITRIFILFLLIIYPFVSYWVVHFLYKIFDKIKDMIIKRAPAANLFTL
jgi:hypothetical protein